MQTRIVAVRHSNPPGYFPPDTTPTAPGDRLARLEEWRVSEEARRGPLAQAAEQLRNGNVPVAFPTETVYGLGADAVRGEAVRAIFAVKGRPADNPLIVHVCDLAMLRGLLAGDGGDDSSSHSCIPACYEPLIERFWPGPLTLLLPLPTPSPLAAEVTAGLPTVGVRMPASPLALTLIKLAGTPLAAPSANASTRPSPTAARHVRDDLDGRIALVLDGGPCDVGVESTVVDGLCDPPAVLRPGGVAIDELRACPGWEHVVCAYKDRSCEGGNGADKEAPRAPGMKYKHYSPRARVILYEASRGDASAGPSIGDVAAAVVPVAGESRTVGVIRTKRWRPGAGIDCEVLRPESNGYGEDQQQQRESPLHVLVGHLKDQTGGVDTTGRVYDIGLGPDTASIAQGLFAALRGLDRLGADTIFVEGIEDHADVAAAVMNRLRKAASEIRA